MEAPGDVAAQAARAVALLTDDALHGRIAQAGRKRAHERFGTERIIPQYERFYQEIIGRN